MGDRWVFCRRSSTYGVGRAPHAFVSESKSLRSLQRVRGLEFYRTIKNRDSVDQGNRHQLDGPGNVPGFCWGWWCMLGFGWQILDPKSNPYLRRRTWWQEERGVSWGELIIIHAVQRPCIHFFMKPNDTPESYCFIGPLWGFRFLFFKGHRSWFIDSLNTHKSVWVDSRIKRRWLWSWRANKWYHPVVKR